MGVLGLVCAPVLLRRFKGFETSCTLLLLLRLYPNASRRFCGICILRIRDRHAHHLRQPILLLALSLPCHASETQEPVPDHQSLCAAQRSTKAHSPSTQPQTIHSTPHAVS